jgi:hypothetical protein
MANFSQELGISPPTNMSGRSQGVPTNRVGEVLGEGLANVMEGAAVTADKKIQANIRGEVENVFNITNAGFGIDDGAGLAQADQYRTGNDKPVVPPEFEGTGKEFQGRLQTLMEARAQGAYGETHYWSLLSASMKDVKAKYPGYAEVIDNIYQDVTGAKPAHAVRAAMWGDINAAEAEARSKASAVDNDLEKLSEFWAAEDAFKQYAGNPSAMPPEMKEQVLRFARSNEANAKKVTMAKGEIELLEAEGTLTAKATERNATIAAQAIGDTMMKRIPVAGGGTTDMDGFIDMVNSKRGKVTQDEMLQWESAVTKMELEFEQTFEREMAAFPNLSPEAKKKIKEGQTARMTALKQAVVTGDTDLVGTNLRYMKHRTQWREKNLTNDAEIDLMLNVITRNPDLNTAIMEAKGDVITQKLDDATADFVIDGIASGVLDVAQALNAVKKSDADPATVTNATTAVVNIFNKLFDPKYPISDEHLKVIVDENFGAKDGKPSALSEFMTMISADNNGKMRLYEKLTDPSMAVRIAKLGPDAQNKYTSFLIEQFAKIPEVNNALMNASGNVGSDSKFFEVTWDTNNDRFVAVPTALGKEKLAAKREQQGSLGLGGPAVNGPQSPQNQDMLETMRATLQGQLDRVNLLSKRMVHAVSLKEDVDADQYLGAVLQMYGINTTKGEVGKKAKTPLTGKPSDKEGTSGDTREKLSRLEGTEDMVMLARYNAIIEDENEAFTIESDEDDDADAPLPRVRSLVGYAESGGDADAFVGMSDTPGVRFRNAGQEKGIDPKFRSILDTTSQELGIPLTVTSGHRSAAYNRKVGGARGSRHIAGDASDLSVAGMNEDQKKQLVRTLLKNGAKRVITYSRSPNMIHIDALGDKPYFMHDKSRNNLGRAPQWLKEVMEEYS